MSSFFSHVQNSRLLKKNMLKKIVESLYKKEVSNELKPYGNK